MSNSTPKGFRRGPGCATYAGDAGQQRFLLDDHLHASSGIDLIETMRQQANRQRANQLVDQTQRRLEKAFERGSDPAERAKLLQGVISENVRQLDSHLGEVAASGSDGRTAREGTVRALSAADDIDEVIELSRKARREWLH